MIFTFNPAGALRAAVLCLWLCAGLVGRGAEALGVGAATQDITPPPGWRMSGYFNERISTGTNDPLQAKALVMQQGKTKAAIVVTDLMGIPLETTSLARRKASALTGIPEANILVAATHSHTGPLFFDAMRDYFHKKAVAEHGKDPHEPFDYSVWVADRIAVAIQSAQSNAVPSRVEVGSFTNEPPISFNRRFHMKNGTVVFNPGKLNTNIVKAAGPIDPEGQFLYFKTKADNKTVTSLTVFALHPDTTGGARYSGDYPHHFEQVLKKHFGGDTVALFGNGTCGDINHIDVASGRPQSGVEESARLGAALAQSVIWSLPDLKEASKPALAVRSTIIEAPLQVHTDAQVAAARAKMPKMGGPELSFLDQVEAYKIMNVHDMLARNGKSWPVEVQVFKIADDIAVVGLPGEIFVDLGLAIKRGSPFRHTLVIELSNDYIGYVPTRKAFAEGSYETVNSRLAPGGGELLVETALKLLREARNAR